MLSVLQNDVTVRRSNSQSIRCRRRGNKTQMAHDLVHDNPHVKVHMKRFLTVVFHFIIVKINIKESYIR